MIKPFNLLASLGYNEHQECLFQLETAKQNGGQRRGSLDTLQNNAARPVAKKIRGQGPSRRQGGVQKIETIAAFECDQLAVAA
mmetsp:Transcript_265/g.579  ORF Transcript_265/g.579 Transcript_265/m.579 type:complete len:83 (+) Transcript_265:142-390(+)